MATLNPLRPSVLLNWAGRSVTADLSDRVVSITYTESQRKKSAGRDKIQLTLSNQDRIFCNAWYPSEGDKLQPGITWLDLLTGKRGVWRWGAFTIDDIRFRFGPDQVIIGALASGPASDKMEQTNNRTWTNISLKALCTTLAGEASMECSFNGTDTVIPEVQQRNETSRELLQRLSEKFDLPVSLKDQTLYAGTPKLGTLEVDLTNRSMVKSADIVAASQRNTSSAVTLHYYNAQTKEFGEYSTGKASDEKHHQVYYNVDAKDMTDAKRQAEALANKGGSKHEAESRLVLINTPVAVGQPVKLINAGKIPANWKIAQQTTSISNSVWQASLRLEKAS